MKKDDSGLPQAVRDRIDEEIEMLKDSGEREVLPEASAMYWRHHVAIPTNLAQRILAALDWMVSVRDDDDATISAKLDELYAIASELRAAVERRKP